jgi:plastocyanin
MRRAPVIGGPGLSRRLRYPLAAAALAGCFFAAGCGGGEPSRPMELAVIGGETRGSGEQGGYALEGGEIRSNPGPTIRVKVGEPVTMTFDNVHGRFYGESIEHDFAIVADKDDFTPLSPDALWGAKTEVIYPDDAPGVVTFTPDDPGSYYYVCFVPGHVERGMWGRFIVEE